MTNLAGFIKPLVVSMANTVMSVFGNASVAESVSFDRANQIEPHFLIGDGSIKHTDRQVTGSLVVEARSLATVNWFDRALERTRETVQFANGTAAGNIFKLDCGAVEVGASSDGQRRTSSTIRSR